MKYVEHEEQIQTIPTNAKETERMDDSQQSISRVDRYSIAANLFSSLLLRIAGRTSFILLSFYLGEHFTSATIVALVLETFYITELLLAPIAGSLSDRIGRRPFLLAAPILGAIATGCLFICALFFPHPDTATFDIRLVGLLLLILCGRLLEGATTAFSAPACLGHIVDTTTGNERLRTQVMTIFEVITVGGLALAIPFGGQVSAMLGTWGFLVVIALYLVNIVITLRFVREGGKRITGANQHGSLLASLHLLRNPRVFAFLPAWLSINTLVGAWLTLLILLMAYPNPAADLRFPGQMIYGGFSKVFASQAIGASGLLFLAGMGLWMLVLPRVRRTTVMLVGLVGLAFCIGALTLINGLAENFASMAGDDTFWFCLLIPFVVLGALLFSGFPPASLTQMAALSEMMPEKRGATMGLYSVVLGIGQLLGATLGGVAVDLGGFNGLMVLSLVLGISSTISVMYMRVHSHDLLTNNAPSQQEQPSTVAK